MKSANHNKNFSWLTTAIAAVCIVVIVAGMIALLQSDPWGEEGSGLSNRFTYDLKAYQTTDPALIGYQQTGKINLELKEARAIARDSGDLLHVAGDREIHVFAPGGNRLRVVPLNGEPYCLTVAGPNHAAPGRCYVGMKDHIETLKPDGSLQAAWDAPDPKTHFASITVSERTVFAADAGRRVVRCYSPDGKPLATFSGKYPQEKIHAFTVPSPYFAVAMAPDGLLRVVNPGMHKVLALTEDGSLEMAWGRPANEIRGFAGCCNPARIAILPDGSIVTAEKGELPRVKVYSSTGEFQCVVAGVETFASTGVAVEKNELLEHKVLDVAADSNGRILVLDPTNQMVRIFEKKEAKP